MATDHYDTLGVQRSASQDEIQKAYRSLARKYHPDLNPDDESAKKQFQAVQTAFDVLNDPKKRALYDRYGHNFEAMGEGGAGTPGGSHRWSGPGGGQTVDFDLGDLFGGGGGPNVGGGSFSDLFKQFGQRGPRAGGGPQRPRRGADIEHELTVPFATAVSGGQAVIAVHRHGGSTETIDVKIPPGIDDGQKIRLRDQGEAGAAGGESGDILITLRVAPHPSFERRGKHLHVRVPVTLAESTRGAKIDVPTPSGTIALSVPAGTSSGTKLRVKGHGVPSRGKEAGDLFAEILIVLPPELTAGDREELAEISDRHPQSPRSQLRW